MIAFRFSSHDWMGLAVAANMKELFWQIDQHGDPYDVEIMSLKSGSVCIKQKLNDEDEYGEPDTPEEVEWCEDIWYGEWKNPKWPLDVYSPVTVEDQEDGLSRIREQKDGLSRKGN